MIANKSTLLCLFSLLASASAFSSQATPFRSSTALEASVSRDDFLKSMAVAVAGSAIMTTMPGMALAGESTTLENGVSYIVKKKGDGPVPDIGELCAIRFSAYTGTQKIDDIFDTPEPYYTRVGSGGLIKGVESTLPLMRVGDRWELTVPSNLAFGPKGRPASAGKPRIPGDAVVTFDVEMVGLPGKEPELIELIGDV